MKLPGTRPDVLRTKALSGPSPVGGAFGGTESQRVMTLDDFELQAAHYNMACAHARLGNLDDVRVRQSGRLFYLFCNLPCDFHFGTTMWLRVPFSCCYFSHLDVCMSA